MKRTSIPRVAVVAALPMLLAALPARTEAQDPPAGAPKVQKLASGLYRIGAVEVDTSKRELRVPGRMNEVMILEFVANTRGGMKAYESAITLEADAFEFNAALLLIGLDRKRSRAPAFHFDPQPPAGDEVTLHIEFTRDGAPTRLPVEDLLYDKEKNATVPASGWVYTGSTFLENGRYLADLDGALIGFVHSPAPIIEQVGGAGVSRFGRIVLNPNLGLPPNTAVTLHVRAVGSSDKSARR